MGQTVARLVLVALVPGLAAGLTLPRTAAVVTAAVVALVGGAFVVSCALRRLRADRRVGRLDLDLG